MKFDTSFSGRIVQVTDALSYGDAVSNQLIRMDRLLRQNGFDSSIHARWHEAKVAHLCLPLQDLALTDRDVLIVHFYGYSEFALPAALDSYCTRVLVFHNITPHSFFEADSQLAAFCRKGREQLASLLPQFHYFWADSQFNLDELIALGADPARSAVLPIVVDPAAAAPAALVAREPGSWLFVGRIAPNKGQADLVRLFAEVRRRAPDAARHLYLVGGMSDDGYGALVQQEIAGAGLQELVTVTGKVSDEERDSLLARAALYVSMSQHEGFGVPLIEAPLAGLPVVALDNSAIGETMGYGPGLCADPAQMAEQIILYFAAPETQVALLAVQQANAARFSAAAVEAALFRCLRLVLPERRRFRTVTVAICTYNRRNYLERVLDYLSYQTSGDFEVVVVDGPSDDGTKELLQQYEGRIKIAHNPARNLSISRNLSADLASGDIIAYIDDDALPFDDWIAGILREYNARPLATCGVGGPAYYAGTLRFQVEDIAFNALAEARVNVTSDAIGKDGWVRSMIGTNCTFTVESLRGCGGFDEQYDYFLDESDLCYRLQMSGELIAYAPGLFLRHEFAESANRRSKHNFNWFTICKNMAYFIAAYSGRQGAELDAYLKQRMQTERVAPLDAALAAGEISTEAHAGYIDAIWRGTAQGLQDVAHCPRTRPLQQRGGAFLPFAATRNRLRPGPDMQALHVCILSKEFPPFAAGGGIGTLYYHLASELLLMGHSVTVIVPADQDNEFQQGRFRVRYAARQSVALDHVDAGFANNMKWSLSALHALADLHARDPVDVVDSALWDAEALALAMLPMAERPPLLLRLVTPFAIAARINEWNVPPAVAELFVGAERRLIEGANAIVPISDAIAASIQKGHGLVQDARWHKIPCGIAYWPSFDVNQGYDSFQEFDNIPHSVFDSERLVVFVGRLERRKGIDLLLGAAAAILDSDPTAQLVIAGRDVGGWTAKAMELVPPAVRSRLHFLGEVSDATREKLLAKAYCLVFPSRYESFGLVPLEAFVHGTPVVASRSGAIPEVVGDGLAGLLFDEDNAASLAHCVQRLLQDTVLRARLADGARATIRRLSSRNSAQATVAVYASLIAGAQQATGGRV